MKVFSGTKIGLGTLALALGLAVAVEPASAQEAEGWTPWLGCWVSIEAPESPMLCVIPAEGGVELRRVSGIAEPVSRTLRADGAEHPTTVEGCVGVERASFSEDRQRVFVESRMTCDGQVDRSSRGILAMVEPDQWIESEAVVIAGQSVGWVKRYLPAPASRIEEAGLTGLWSLLEERGMAVEAARLAASAPISAEDIIEATRRTDPEAVRGWIAEQGDPIRLDAERLVRMADAGVPAEVIDVAVATSYPERFQVARRLESEDRLRPSSHLYVDPWGYSDYYRYSRYDRYGYGLYGMYGYPGYYGSYRPTVIVVEPAGTSGGGRVVKGRGYVGGSSGSASQPSRTAKPAGVRSSGATRSSPAVRSGSSSSTSSSGKASKGKAKKKGGG